jgi:hypothetical protein
MYNYIFRCKYKLDAPRSLNRSPGKTTPYNPYAKCNFHRWAFWTFEINFVIHIIFNIMFGHDSLISEFLLHILPYIYIRLFGGYSYHLISLLFLCQSVSPYNPYAKCNFHRWAFWTLRVCIWNMHLGNT